MQTVLAPSSKPSFNNTRTLALRELTNLNEALSHASINYLLSLLRFQFPESNALLPLHRTTVSPVHTPLAPAIDNSTLQLLHLEEEHWVCSITELGHEPCTTIYDGNSDYHSHPHPIASHLHILTEQQHVSNSTLKATECYRHSQMVDSGLILSRTLSHVFTAPDRKTAQFQPSLFAPTSRSALLRMPTSRATSTLLHFPHC
jgi:hypothetical protein